MNDLFTVCKIEAGRAVLLSQNDYELIEFPAKLLPNACEKGTVKISVTNDGDNLDTEDRAATAKLLQDIEKQYGIDDDRIAAINAELSQDFLKIENLGSTAAILSWPRSIYELFGPNVKIDQIILDCESALDYHQEFVDFVIKGLKPISLHDTRCRVSLPIDLTVRLMIKSSVGYFKSNQIDLKCGKFDDFSGIFVLTDLTGPEETINRLQFIREQGGYITRQYSPSHPITAIVTDSFDSDLFKLGILNNLPVVSDTWLMSLVATMELPQFEDHLIRRKN